MLVSVVVTFWGAGPLVAWKPPPMTRVPAGQLAVAVPGPSGTPAVVPVAATSSIAFFVLRQ